MHVVALDHIGLMMTSSNGNIFRVTGPLCGEFTGHRWIPLTKGQWRGALMFSSICAWINGWVNNRKTGDLRRHRTHYDVTVMFQCVPFSHNSALPSWDYVECNCVFAVSPESRVACRIENGPRDHRIGCTVGPRQWKVGAASRPFRFARVCATIVKYINTSPPGQNGRHFADDMFKCIFLNENVWISIKILMKFVPKGTIYNISTML